jgi:hypothetical protein
VGNIGLSLSIAGAVVLLTYPSFIFGYIGAGQNVPAVMLYAGAALLFLGIVVSIFEYLQEQDARLDLATAVRALAPVPPTFGVPGAPLAALHCYACGTPNAAGTRFCSRCGRPFLVPPRSPP